MNRPPADQALSPAAVTTSPTSPVTVGLSKGDGTPLHHQIFLVLRDRILGGRHQPGETLPGEEELARLFQVSRVTVRRALATLETHGLIEKRQGVGTFVRQHAARQPIHAPMSELLGHMTEVVGETEVRLVEFGYEPAPAPVRALFDSPADALFQRAIRLRCFEDNRILHLTTYIPETIGRRLGQDAMASGSLYDLLLKNGVSFGSIEQVVSATLADPVVAARLQIEVGSPLLQIRRMHFDSRQQPVEYLEQLAAPGSFELRMSLQPGELRRWTP